MLTSFVWLDPTSGSKDKLCYKSCWLCPSFLVSHTNWRWDNSIYFSQSPLSLGSYHAHTIQSFSQSVTAIIEFALYNVYCPLGGLVELVALWYKLFQQHNHRVSVYWPTWRVVFPFLSSTCSWLNAVTCSHAHTHAHTHTLPEADKHTKTYIKTHTQT